MERETSMLERSSVDWLPLLHSQTGDCMCPDWGLNPQAFRCGTILSPTEPHQPGPFCFSVCILLMVVFDALIHLGGILRDEMNAIFYEPKFSFRTTFAVLHIFIPSQRNGKLRGWRNCLDLLEEKWGHCLFTLSYSFWACDRCVNGVLIQWRQAGQPKNAGV